MSKILRRREITDNEANHTHHLTDEYEDPSHTHRLGGHELLAPETKNLHSPSRRYFDDWWEKVARPELYKDTEGILYMDHDQPEFEDALKELARKAWWAR